MKQDVAQGTVDVMVCDGFTGMWFSKPLRVWGCFFYGMLKQLFMASMENEACGLLVKPGAYGLQKENEL